MWSGDCGSTSRNCLVPGRFSDGVGVLAQIALRESLRASSMPDQLAPEEVQDHERVILEWQLEPAWIGLYLVRPRDDQGSATDRQAGSSSELQ